MSPNEPPVPPGRAAPDAATRPSSLWPESTRAEAAASAELPSHFDALFASRTSATSLAQATFDVCHPALALRALLLALVALAGAGSAEGWLQRQAALAFGGAAATGLWLVVMCALRRRLRARSQAWRAGVALVAGALAAGFVWAPLAWARLVDAGGLRALSVLLSGAALAALLWAWLDLRSRIWDPANASARLAELQSRIRPHFLFNALNTALALVRVDPTRAEGVLEDLAELFRVALAEVGESVTLAEEIELARRYLAIEAVRFGPRLAVRWDIDPRTHDARVPPLVLQPLVENAVRHGIEPAAAGGRVLVRATRKRGQVMLTVSNTLAPPSDGVEDRVAAGNGMALANVRERLHLLHDLAAQCDVWREGAADTPEGELFHARITLPAP
jgi:two-component system, LytTR family, sensor histidine kinase AlgZ